MARAARQGRTNVGGGRRRRRDRTSRPGPAPGDPSVDPVGAGNEIIEQTSKALGGFFTEAIQILENRMATVLQPNQDTYPLKGMSLQLTRKMCELLIENLDRALGLPVAAPPGDVPAGGATANRPRARRSKRRRKPAPRTDQ